MLRTETVRENIMNLKTRMTEIPQVQDAFALAEANPLLVTKVFFMYLRAIKRLATLSDDEIKIIERVNETLDGTKHKATSASKTRGHTFVRGLGLHVSAQLVSISWWAANPRSNNYQSAQEQLSAMLLGGTHIHARGEKPKDGDPESDAAIWGHTQIKNPYVMIHFITAHYLERNLTQNLHPGHFPMSQRKDYFLSSLTDVLALDWAMGGDNADLAELAQLWNQPRGDDGTGLGWLSNERLNAFKEAVTPQ